MLVRSNAVDVIINRLGRRAGAQSRLKARWVTHHVGVQSTFMMFSGAAQEITR